MILILKSANLYQVHQGFFNLISTRIDNRTLLQTSVGVRIKDRRKQIEMTLEDLAAKTGLTASFISQVERGKANVSLHSLQIIAEALSVPVFYFVAKENITNTPLPKETPKPPVPIEQKQIVSGSYNPVVAPSRRSRLVLANTGLELELLVPNIGRKLIAFKARLAPQTFHIANHMKEPTEEILYMISGTLTLEFTDATYILHPDETIYFEGEKLIRMVNNSDVEDTVWISTITPGIF